MNTLNVKIQHIIDIQIKPYIMGHNGNIIFHNYKDGIVYVALTGSCISCPFSAMTLKLGVLEILQKELPEIKDVELVET
jgi:Fe-S cluster biogenesis protein NfuA